MEGFISNGASNRTRKRAEKQTMAVLITIIMFSIYWFLIKLQNIIVNEIYFNIIIWGRLINRYLCLFAGI